MLSELSFEIRIDNFLKQCIRENKREFCAFGIFNSRRAVADDLRALVLAKVRTALKCRVKELDFRYGETLDFF